MAHDGIGTDQSASPLDREEIAKIEVGHTTVSPRVARATVGWFLGMLIALPLTELVSVGGVPAARPGTMKAAPQSDPQTAWAHLARLPEAVDRRLIEAREAAPRLGAWGTIVTVNRAVLEATSAFETGLEDESAVGRALRPQTQRVLSGWLGAGNERVYVGRDGWLFYRPDVEYVTAGGFLERREIAQRRAAAGEHERTPQPDARPAIRQFKRDLDARGIALVLVPTPVKSSIHPGQLAGSANGESREHADQPVQNPSYRTFVEEMVRAGVIVFDPAKGLASRAAREPQYLATDTHWRPEAMQQTAQSLAAFLQQHDMLPHAPSAGYDTERREARQIGDTAAMLDLPAGQSLYPPERVTLRFVTDAAGEPWRPAREADVLLLGDSFTNMYSLPSMGWGEAAGFAEQLSYALQRPVDRIVQNDQGAHATRAILRRELDSGSDRLTGKRVVIWQFAARELAFGDWQTIELPPVR